MNGAVHRFLEMADDATRARTRVIYCLEPPGADTYIFGVRLRPDGSFAEVDDPPETDGRIPEPGCQLARGGLRLSHRERTDRHAISIQISERELHRSRVRVNVRFLFELTDK
jgi:hypothetical protein